MAEPWSDRYDKVFSQRPPRRDEAMLNHQRFDVSVSWLILEPRQFSARLTYRGIIAAHWEYLIPRLGYTVRLFVFGVVRRIEHPRVWRLLQGLANLLVVFNQLRVGRAIKFFQRSFEFLPVALEL